MERFYHSTARGDFRPILGRILSGRGRVQIAVGFLSSKGIRDLAGLMDLSQLDFLVFGHPGPADLRAAAELYRAIGAGKVYIHPGFAARAESDSVPRRLYRPMLHSKIFLKSGDSATYSALVGSVNLTGYALEGKNAEAGVVLSGDQSDPQFGRIRSALAAIKAQSIPFDPSDIPKYLSWYRFFLQELEQQAEDAQEEFTPTVSVIGLRAEFVGARLPHGSEVLYFEVPPRYIGKFPRIDQDVDLWLYPRGASGPPLALAARTTTSSLTGHGTSARGTRGGRSGTFEDIDWIITDLSHPLVQYFGRKPSPKPTEAQQVVLTILGTVNDAYGLGDINNLTYAPIRARVPVPFVEVDAPEPREIADLPPGSGDGRTSEGIFPALERSLEDDPPGGWLPIKSLTQAILERPRKLDFSTLESLDASASGEYGSIKLEPGSDIVILRRVHPSKPRLPGWTEKGLSRQTKL